MAGLFSLKCGLGAPLHIKCKCVGSCLLVLGEPIILIAYRFPFIDCLYSYEMFLLSFCLLPVNPAPWCKVEARRAEAAAAEAQSHAERVRRRMEQQAQPHR